ncbi:MAG: anti-sigma factor domain-containing protein [Pyrinomonadaceae bacterium]
MKGHEEYAELLALGALDAADGAERRALDAHLAACAECRSELRSLSDTAAALALAVTPVAPAPELRARILAALKQTPQDGAQRSVRASGAKASGANVISLDAARRAPRRLFFISRPAFAFAAVAASLLVVALIAATVALWQRNETMKSQLAGLSETLSQMRDELGQTRGELAKAQEQGEILTAPAMRTDELAATKVAGVAVARITYDMNTGRAVFVAANLPAPPAGKEYQLWFIAGGKPLPGSAFTTDAQGRVEVRTTVPPEGRHAQIFAVTLEPAGGLPAPSGEIYLKSKA